MTVKKKLRLALIAVSAAVFLFSGWQLMTILGSYQEGTDTYQDLNQYISFEPAPPATVPTVPEGTAPAPTVGPDLSGWPQVDFEELEKINPDVVGWICIEGTNINYPIVQAEDNDYYLDHLFDGRKNRAGCIFLDARCDPYFFDRHSIIYGHHLKDGTMFTRLMRYKKQSFYDEHSTILLMTPDAYYKIRVFSGYVANNRSSAWDLDLDDEAHAAWLQELQEKSCFQTNYVPSPDASIITLSTCTYEFDNAKFLLHGYIEETIDLPQP